MELRSAIAEARALLSRLPGNEKKNFPANGRMAGEPCEGLSYDGQRASDENSGHDRQGHERAGDEYGGQGYEGQPAGKGQNGRDYGGQLTADGQSGEYGESVAESLTEGFKRYIAKRESAVKTQSAANSGLPPQTERVLRVFHGTIVK